MPEGPGADGRLHLIGSFEISDYLDLIAPAERSHEVCEALLQAIESQAEVRGLELYNLPEASPTLASMESLAPGRGWTVSREKLQPCPVVSLDGGWEGYLARLDKKQRHELRRKLRRAEESPDEVRLRIVSPSDDIEAQIESFLALMALGADKARFLQPAMRRYFLGLTRGAFTCGCLHLAFLDVDGVPAAAYWSFDYNDRLWVYNSGLNPAFSALSPGWVLLGRLIRWAIDAGRREVDFLRGEEDDKSRLGGVARAIYRLTLTRECLARPVRSALEGHHRRKPGGALLGRLVCLDQRRTARVGATAAPDAAIRHRHGRRVGPGVEERADGVHPPPTGGGTAGCTGPAGCHGPPGPADGGHPAGERLGGLVDFGARALRSSSSWHGRCLARRSAPARAPAC